MEWELKTEMIRLGNQGDKQALHSFVLKHIDSFDMQAWDMFAMITELIVDEMKSNVDYWKQIYNRLKNIDCNDKAFGLRAGMRISLMQVICEDIFKEPV